VPKRPSRTQPVPMTPAYFSEKYGDRWWSGSSWFEEMEPTVFGRGRSAGVDMMQLFNTAPLTEEAIRAHVWSFFCLKGIAEVKAGLGLPGPYRFQLSEEQAERLEEAFETIEDVVACAKLQRDEDLCRRIERFSTVNRAADALMEASRDKDFRRFLSALDAD
jgi:hypothetical protein